MRLFSYSLRVDDGAAPNPYFGVCTLTICKPGIRKSAAVGDWVVGLGTKNPPSGIGDLSHAVAYAMKISDVLSLEDYDKHCLRELSGKIPKVSKSSTFTQLVGDCIYEFGKTGGPRQRRGVHNEGNRATDLAGKNSLLSDHFYYFGAQAIQLPDHLCSIAHPYQGYKVNANDKVRFKFVEWLESESGFEPNKLYGAPLLEGVIMQCVKKGEPSWATCAKPHKDDDDSDPRTIC